MSFTMLVLIVFFCFKLQHLQQLICCLENEITGEENPRLCFLGSLENMLPKQKPTQQTQGGRNKKRREGVGKTTVCAVRGSVV